MRSAALIALGLCLAATPVLADMMQANARARAKDFDASAPIRCAQEVGQVMGECEAFAARAGTAVAVVARFGNGFARTLSFQDGAFMRGSATMSGVGTDTDWHRVDGVYHVRVDDQRFEIPEALVLGE